MTSKSKRNNPVAVALAFCHAVGDLPKGIHMRTYLAASRLTEIGAWRNGLRLVLPDGLEMIQETDLFRTVLDVKVHMESLGDWTLFQTWDKGGRRVCMSWHGPEGRYLTLTVWPDGTLMCSEHWQARDPGRTVAAQLTECIANTATQYQRDAELRRRVAKMESRIHAAGRTDHP